MLQGLSPPLSGTPLDSAVLVAPKHFPSFPGKGVVRQGEVSGPQRKVPRLESPRPGGSQGVGDAEGGRREFQVWGRGRGQASVGYKRGTCTGEYLRGLGKHFLTGPDSKYLRLAGCAQL